MADPTSATFMDWRTRYPSGRQNLPQNILDMQNASRYTSDVINNMPYVFDPQKFIGQTQGQIGQAVHPTMVPPAAATAIQNGDLQGLLQMLGPSFMPLLSGIFGRGG
jgi:hypothetical protein